MEGFRLLEHGLKLCTTAGLLLVVGCQAQRAVTPTSDAISDESGHRPISGTSSAAPSARLGVPVVSFDAGTTPEASVASFDAGSAKSGTFIQVVETGADVTKWDVQVRGLPAVDQHTGSIIVADVTREVHDPSLELSLLWLRPGQKFPFRVWSVLDSYDPDSSMDNSGLADGVRVRTRDANEMLASLTLRATVPCASDPISWCTHPQRFACGELSAEIAGDKLRWRSGPQSGETAHGWGTVLTKSGEVETNTCIEQAHLDADTKQIIARVTTASRLPNGYSWVNGRQWHIISLAIQKVEPAAKEPRSRPPSDATAPSSAKPKASIKFMGKGPDLQKWDFSVHGLPAVDLRTGSIVVADLPRSLGVVGSLGLSLLWLQPGQKSRSRIWSVLDKSVATDIMYDDHTQPDALAARARALADGVRERTRDANEMLASLELRPIVRCNVQRMTEWCTHPQRLVCSKHSGELQGDKLHWHLGTETHEVVLGWGVAPMMIGGDGPAKEIITCIEEAYLDPEHNLIVARAWDSCKERAGDVCMGESKWRVITLR